MRRQEEQQLQAIQELSSKKDEFISVASHELKTPLTSAKAYLQIAERSASNSPQVAKFVSGALKQLDRLQKLTADLLDVSKINAGKLDYKMSELNFSELLQEAVSNFQSTISTHAIEIEQNQEALIECDWQRLEQVVNNLISNAVKYSPQANRVVVASSIIQNYLVVSVRDFGVGIPQNRIHLLFERFYRIEETAMHFQGMGLGLFIVSEILNRHKGRFWIESEEGKGSTFYFMLPVKGAQNVHEEIDTEYNYSNSHIAIAVDKDKDFLNVNWLGFQDNQSVRHGCLKMLDMLKKSGLRKVFNDNRNVLGTWSDAAEWVGKDWFPMMEAAGLTHFAWIYSKSTFSQLSADKSVDILQGKVVTRLFNNGKEGEDWLLKV
nr:HAMP domain-containing sensor histidine kinase [Pedobacter sp. SYSU D00873]